MWNFYNHIYPFEKSELYFVAHYQNLKYISYQSKENDFYSNNTDLIKSNSYLSFT